MSKTNIEFPSYTGFKQRQKVASLLRLIRRSIPKYCLGRNNPIEFIEGLPGVIKEFWPDIDRPYVYPNGKMVCINCGESFYPDKGVINYAHKEVVFCSEECVDNFNFLEFEREEGSGKNDREKV